MQFRGTSEIFKIDITAAYLNTPMNDNVKHKWLMLDKGVAAVLMSIDADYWKTFLHRDGKILVELDKIMCGFKERFRVPKYLSGSKSRYRRPPTGGTRL